MGFDDMYFDDMNFDDMDFDTDDDSSFSDDDSQHSFNEDFSSEFDDFDDNYEFHDINYSSFENKIVRIVTKDIGVSSGYKLSDLYGDICIIHKYNNADETLEIERLGKLDKMKIETKYIEQVTGARLSNEAKELLKIYRKSHSKMASSIRKILNAKPQEQQIIKELQQNLHMIGRIAEETYQPIQDRDDIHGNFDTFGSIGSNGNYYDNKSGGLLGGLFSDNKNTTNSSRYPSNSPTVNQQERKGLFGFGFKKDNPMNSNNPFGSSQREFNAFGNSNGFNNSYSSYNSPYNKKQPSNAEIKNSDGMKLFQKNIFGQEKEIYEKSKNGKRKKKPTQMMKNNKLYYVKLYSKEMMIILVKQKEISKGYYERYYYSEYGLIEPKEIVWFREKESNERGYHEIKRSFDNVFRLENKLTKLHEKMALNDKIARTEDAKKVILLNHLHKIIAKLVKKGAILYQNKSKINIKVATYQKIRYIVVNGLEPNVAKHVIPKHNTYLRNLMYKSTHRTLMIPLIKGNRYVEIKALLKELIELLGNEEKHVLLNEMNTLLNKIV